VSITNSNLGFSNSRQGEGVGFPGALPRVRVTVAFQATTFAFALFYLYFINLLVYFPIMSNSRLTTVPTLKV
jgi:hypothetical protein